MPFSDLQQGLTVFSSIASPSFSFRHKPLGRRESLLWSFSCVLSRGVQYVLYWSTSLFDGGAVGMEHNNLFRPHTGRGKGEEAKSKATKALPPFLPFLFFFLCTIVRDSSTQATTDAQGGRKGRVSVAPPRYPSASHRRGEKHKTRMCGYGK